MLLAPLVTHLSQCLGLNLVPPTGWNGSTRESPARHTFLRAAFQINFVPQYQLESNHLW